MRIKRQSVWQYVSVLLILSGNPLFLQAEPLRSDTTSSSHSGTSSETNKAPASVSDSMAGDMEVAAFQKTITNQLQEIANRSAAVEDTVMRHQGVFGIFVVLLVGLVLMLRFGRRMIAMAFDRRKPATVGSASPVLVATLRAEEDAFAKFAASFRIGPKATECNGSSASAPIVVATDSTKPADQTPLRHCHPDEFLRSVPVRVSSCRNLLQEASRLSGEPARHKILLELAAKVLSLKQDASHPDLAPFWQVISSLEGLLKQLTEKPANVNPSTLRTLAGCVDLLDRLCSAGLKPDLLKTPPVRFLAVDDDPVSRHTMSFALKRALNAPDVAENGTDGLALAKENAYDVIFLDVQMPGMDGFELCKKIRSSEFNQATPVVFVTCQSDFSSRAQSSLAGGCDLIGKPFLTFEISAKALMLALRNRLSRVKTAEAQAA